MDLISDCSSAASLSKWVDCQTNTLKKNHIGVPVCSRRSRAALAVQFPTTAVFCGVCRHYGTQIHAALVSSVMEMHCFIWYLFIYVCLFEIIRYIYVCVLGYFIIFASYILWYIYIYIYIYIICCCISWIVYILSNNFSLLLFILFILFNNKSYLCLGDVD